MRIEPCNLSFRNKPFSTFSNAKGVQGESGVKNVVQDVLKKSSKNRRVNRVKAILNAADALITSKTDDKKAVIKPIKNYNQYMEEYGLK